MFKRKIKIVLCYKCKIDTLTSNALFEYELNKTKWHKEMEKENEN